MQDMEILKTIGWNNYWQSQIESMVLSDEHWVGRVTNQEKGHYRVQFDQETYCFASARGRLKFTATETDMPTVGDWVIVHKQSTDGVQFIEEIIKRKSVLIRKVAGEVQAGQLMGANLDFVFVLTSLNLELNEKRLERYLTVIFESGAQPVILLTKIDQMEDGYSDEIIQDLRTRFKQEHIYSISNKTLEGYEHLQQFLTGMNTLALIGSSGVGKSTLANQLIGKVFQKTQHIREDDSKGRHTTTSRQIVFVGNEFCILDTPGMRELQLWGNDEGVKESFEDLEELSLNCRFSNCSHIEESDCALQKALKAETIEVERFENYIKLRAEIQKQSIKNNSVKSTDRKRRTREHNTNARHRLKSKGKL